MPDSLATVTKIQMDIEDCLRSVGEVFRAFRDQDSTSISYGVLSSDRCWFVKHSEHPGDLNSLERAYSLDINVRDAALPRLSNRFETANGVALVCDWVPSGNLYASSRYSAARLRVDLTIPRVRFWSAPVDVIAQFLNTIFGVQLTLADRGYVAVDLYDGCFIYD